MGLIKHLGEKNNINIKSLILLFVFCFCTNAYAQTGGVSISYITNPDNSCDFYYQKDMPGTYHLMIKFKSIRNADKYFYEGNVRDNSGFLFQLKPKNSNKKIKFTCEPFYTKGNPKPNFDKNFNYLLPFKKGKDVSISKVPYMLSNLNEGNSNYLYTLNCFQSTKSETVHAMRKGIVVGVENIHDVDPNSFSFLDEKRNQVIIEHDDGTYAVYSGFKKNTILVKQGQTVLPTDILGVLEKSVNNNYYLFFDTYYLGFVSDIFPDKKENLNEKIHVSLNSLFYTDKGLVALCEEIYKSCNYKVETTQEIINMELTQK